MNLEEISTLIENRQFDEAINECNLLLAKMPEERIEILRIRAFAFDMAGDSERSLEDHERIFEEEGVTIKDFYLAAFRAVFAAQFEKARVWFSEVLRLSREQEETWFLSATLFHLSYVEMQLNDYGKAIEYLNEATLVDADVGMPIPEGGICTSEQLREEIERRALGE